MDQYIKSNIESYNHIRMQRKIKYHTSKIARIERYLKHKCESPFHSKDEIYNLMSSIQRHSDYVESLRQELLLPFL